MSGWSLACLVARQTGGRGAVSFKSVTVAAPDNLVLSRRRVLVVVALAILGGLYEGLVLARSVASLLCPLAPEGSVVLVLGSEALTFGENRRE